MTSECLFILWWRFTCILLKEVLYPSLKHPNNDIYRFIYSLMGSSGMNVHFGLNLENMTYMDSFSLRCVAIFNNYIYSSILGYCLKYHEWITKKKHWFWQKWLQK